MRPQGARVLIIDDDRSMCSTLSDALSLRGFRVRATPSPNEALDLVGQGEYDAVAVDLNMPEMNGLHVCERIVNNRPDLPVVVVTAFGNLDTAIAAIRAGAFDFITKPFTLDALGSALERAVERRAVIRELRRLRELPPELDTAHQILGDSRAVRSLMELVHRIAGVDAPAFITGPSGSGKKMAARAIHHQSKRRDQRLSILGSGRTPPALLDAEIFGGGQPVGGTLVLDDLPELPLAMQQQLGLALKSGTDFRVIATAGADFESRADEGKLDRSLLEQLMAMHIEVPPLSARDNDVLVLAHHFVRHFASMQGKRVTAISSGAAQRLLAYAWPGNVRELRSCIERGVSVAKVEEIVVDDLPEDIRGYRSTHVVLASNDPSTLLPLHEVEKRYILQVMAAVQGNKRHASRVLGLDIKTLRRKLERYGFSGPMRAAGLQRPEN
jgi:two-component system response regulator HydG